MSQRQARKGARNKKPKIYKMRLRLTWLMRLEENFEMKDNLKLLDKTEKLFLKYLEKPSHHQH